MKKKLIYILLSLFAIGCVGTASAQHTVGVGGGLGTAMARFYPKVESRWLWGVSNYTLSWRYYSLPRFVGAVGLDLEYLQRGYSYGYDYYSIMDENGQEQRIYSYYDRNINTIMLPLVWQPHAYLAKNHLRVYLEAAFTLSYNFGGDWKYSDSDAAGAYDWRIERDNRFNYGLAGGAGFALLFGRYEFGVRARYYFGYADILRNRNKYYDNATDGLENPFYLTPLRSPIDNINVSVTLAYRLSRDGFTSWYYKPKKISRTREFKFEQSKTK